MRDEYNREYLALHVARELTADLVIVLAELGAQRGAPAHLRSDSGSKFVACTLQRWLAKRHIKTLYIEPTGPWQNTDA